MLVLIGLGAIHLSGSGSAVPLDDAATSAPATEPDTGPASAPVTSEADAEAQASGDAGGDAPTHGDDESGGAGGGGQDTGNGAGADAQDVVVHVSGAVEQPGLVELSAGARVDDAVQAAGGVSKEADLAAVNLARGVVDGEQIHVPLPGETPPVAAGDPGGDEQAVGEPSGGGHGSSTGPVDINAADASELEDLPGVGPAIAERIIEHREKNGAFRSVDGLLEVSGIGPATLEEIRDRATVSGT